MCAKKASAKKPAKPKAPKLSKTQLLEEKAKLYDCIRAKEKERRKLAARLDELTHERKAAREALGFCETEICGLGHAMDEKHPLFDQADNEKAETKPAEQTAEHAATLESKPAGKDAWRDVAIHEVISDPKLSAKLFDADMTTLGKLSDHMAEQGEWWWKQLQGIGEESAAKISDMLADYWKAHPEYCETQTV